MCMAVCAAACARQQPVIRVAVKTDTDTVRLNLEGSYAMTDLATGEKLLAGRGGLRAGLSVCGQRLCIDTRPTDSAAIRIQASRGLGVQSDDDLIWYRGELDVLADEYGRLSAVNRLDLEDYLRGVLPREVSSDWPMAALQAQAVASRTYALFRMQQAAGMPYDVSADVFSQVYGGRDAERWRTNRAIKRTRGTALVYRDEIVPAFFHASCGGQTEDSMSVWGLDSEVLHSTICPYCKDRPGYAWKRNFHTRAVQELLNSRGYAIGEIRDIEVAERSPSGRAVRLRFLDSDNATLELPGVEFRALMGPDVVRSTKFEVVMQGYYFDLIGHGWGHGVGMCQQGACGMALEGYSMLEILKFYYAGMALEKIY